MKNKTFSDLLRGAGKSHRASEEGEPEPVIDTQALDEEAQEAIPEGVEGIPAIIYPKSDESGLIIIPETPLEVESMPEPVTVLDMEIHTEEPTPAPSNPVEPTTTPEPTPGLGSGELNEEEVVESMKSLNCDGCNIAMVRTGSVEDPAWLIIKDSEPVAKVSFSAQNDPSLHEFMSSDRFPAQVASNAKVNGWDKVLTLLKAKVYTNKGVVAAPKITDLKAVEASVVEDLINCAQLGYAAMRARVRSHSLAEDVFNAVAKSGMPQPDVFVAGAMADPEGRFVQDLFKLATEIRGYSEVGRAEFKQIVANAQIPLPSHQASVSGDADLRARLANASVPLAPSNAIPSKPASGLIR
jgi:hypothetical protein